MMWTKLLARNLKMLTTAPRICFFLGRNILAQWNVCSTWHCRCQQQAEMGNWMLRGVSGVDFTSQATLRAAVYSGTLKLTLLSCFEGSTWCSKYHDKGVMFQELPRSWGKICTSSEKKKFSLVNMNGLPSLAFHVCFSDYATMQPEYGKAAHRLG